MRIFKLFSCKKSISRRMFKERFCDFDRTQTYTCAPFTQGIPHLPLFVFAPSAYLEWFMVLNREDFTKNRAKRTDKGLRDFFCRRVSQSRWHRLGDASRGPESGPGSQPSMMNLPNLWNALLRIFYKRCKMRGGRSVWTGEMACHWFFYEFLHLSVGCSPRISFSRNVSWILSFTLLEMS